jgi:hypothetical protein
MLIALSFFDVDADLEGRTTKLTRRLTRRGA